MEEPKRLLEEGSEFERRLMRAGRSEDPAAQSVRRTLRTVAGLGPVTSAALVFFSSGVAKASQWTGLSGWFTLGGTVVIAGAVAVAVAGASQLASTDSVDNPSKSTGMGAVGPGVAEPLSSVPQVAGSAQTPPASSLVASPAQAARHPGGLHAEDSRRADAPTASPQASTEAVVADVRPHQPRRLQVNPASSTQQSDLHVEASVRPSGSLGSEIRLLDAARRALGQGEASQALRHLARYRALHSGGSLRAEERVLRVRALRAAKRARAAKQLAERELARDPDSPHASTLQETVEAK